MTVILQGRQTWLFPTRPGITATAAVGGPMEGRGPLAASFDYLAPDNRLEQPSFEKAEQKLQQTACEIALAKIQAEPAQINILLGGDLLNQITVSAFTARNLGIPYAGIFAACATSTEGLALAAQLVASNAATKALTVTSSHTSTAERQFRYPNEYGGQKPPYSQYTATAAGAAIVEPSGPITIAAATLGVVKDLNVTDPFQMGAAMAPAFADTVATHLQERGLKADYYDLIISGDLGKVGREIAWELLQRKGIEYDKARYLDCGCLLYDEEQPVFAGGSGCGCSAAVLYGHLMRGLAEGRWRRILMAATGALLSPVSNQQKESIPGISHAVALEVQ